MKNIVAFIAMLLVYMLPALTTPVYAESHEKAADTATTDTATTDADTKKKKNEGEGDEEPECE